MQVIKIARNIITNNTFIYYFTPTISVSMTTQTCKFATKKTTNKLTQQSYSSPFSLRTFKNEGWDENDQENIYLRKLSEIMEDQKSTQLNEKSMQQQNQKSVQLQITESNTKQFAKGVPLAVKIDNSQILMQTISCLFSEQQIKSFFKLIRQYEVETNSIQKQKKTLNKTTKNKTKDMKQSQQKLFREVCALLVQSMEDESSINQFLRLFSQSDCKLLNEEDICKVYTGINEENFSSFSQKRKLDLTYNTIKQQKSQNKNQSVQNVSLKLIKNQFKSLFKQVHTDKSQHNFKKTHHQRFAYDQNEPNQIMKKNKESQFKFKESPITQIQERLFQNRKVVDDNIFLHIQKNSLSNEQISKRNSFGLNWIYAYQLPYRLEKNTVDEFLQYMNQSFGKVQTYALFPYKNMLQREAKSITYEIPDNINFQDPKKEKIKKIKIDTPQPQIQESQSTKPKKKGVPRTKILAYQILDKIRREKQKKLNRSSILLKFASIEDKNKLLTPDYRLFGVNIKEMKNIRFEQAQSKNLVVLSMIPWGCNSTQLVSAINNNLKILDIKIKDPNCILAKGYLFIEFHNFYQSFHATQILHKMKFQNTQLKAQISYGSSTLYKQQYGSCSFLDHHQNLIKKLKQIRSFYGEILSKSSN